MNNKTALLALLTVALSACATIEPTEVGMKISKAGSVRGVTRENIVNGYVGFNPFTTQIVTYPISVQTYTWNDKSGPDNSDESFRFQTSDSVPLNAAVSFSYQIVPDAAPSIYKKFGGDIERITHTNIHNIVRDSITRTASQYRADQLLGQERTKFEDQAKGEIASVLEPIGFTVQTFAFVGQIIPPPTVAAAINAKFTAQQTAIQAQNKVIQSEAEARQAVAKANGEAQSILVRAEAQAKANKILAASLTPELVQAKMVDRWDGKVAQVQGTTGGVLLNIGAGQK